MGKVISFIYGVIAYLMFLIAFLYPIGFVGNLIVPKSIDSGTEAPFWTGLLINVLLLSIFAMQHSVMARPAFKKWITGIISPAIERSTYVLLSSLALLLVYWQWQPITTIVWKAENETIAMILTGVFFFGWLFVLLSTFMINHFELFGLKQIFDNLKDKLAEDMEFQANFFYKIVRHPIMLGFIIAFWATPLMTVGHLIFSVTTTVYIIIAIKYFEEKDLRKLIGKEYEDYQNRVPMIIPFTKRGKEKK
jgi:protein-S-isoprenylcysteine O-methyltransferase Ste14